MNVDQQVHQVELSIQEAKKQIDRKNALVRLSNNKEYKEIFLDGYFKEFAIQQVMLKSEPAQQDAKNQEIIVKNIDGIGALRTHLQSIMALGYRSEEALRDDEITREELLAEEAAA